MSFAALGGGALVVAIVGGIFALLQVRSTARTERYRIAEARLARDEERSDQLQAEEVATTKRLLDAVKAENVELRGRVDELTTEIKKLRQALEAAGVIAP